MPNHEGPYLCIRFRKAFLDRFDGVEMVLDDEQLFPVQGVSGAELGAPPKRELGASENALERGVGSPPKTRVGSLQECAGERSWKPTKHASWEPPRTRWREELEAHQTRELGGLQKRRWEPLRTRWREGLGGLQKRSWERLSLTRSCPLSSAFWRLPTPSAN